MSDYPHNTGDDSDDPTLLPPDTYYEIINPATGEIRFNKDDPEYRVLKQALMTAGFDIDTIQTEDELNDVLGPSRYGHHISVFRAARRAAKAKTSLEWALLHAVATGNLREADRLRKKLKRRNALGLRVISSHTPEE